MTERLQIILLLCITLIGTVASVGMVVLELHDKVVLGHLPSLATGALVALAGLAVTIGQSARQFRIEEHAATAVQVAQTAVQVAEKTREVIDEIHTNTNGGAAELALLREEIRLHRPSAGWPAKEVGP